MSQCTGHTRTGARCRNTAVDAGVCIIHSRYDTDSDQKWCPTCRMRYRVGPPQETYPPSSMSRNDYRWLVNAFRVFDMMAGEERFTASEALAWVRPDITAYGRYYVPEPKDKAA